MCCPICNSINLKTLANRRRKFFRCDSCFFIWADPAEWPPDESARKRYLLHNNEGDEYKSYILKIITNALAAASAFPRPEGGPIKKILDYGSGPNPLASVLLREMGYEVHSYDPFFADEKPLAETFDLGISIEAAEHFKNPLDDFAVFSGALKKGAAAFVQTSIAPIEDNAFLSWWYAEDITHISFYSEKSLCVIAEKLSLELVSIEKQKQIIFKYFC